MTEPYTDPYEVLGLARTATAAALKQAYFALVRAHPPERDPEIFKQVRAAYERLRDPSARVETDMLLLERWPTPARARRGGPADRRPSANSLRAGQERRRLLGSRSFGT